MTPASYCWTCEKTISWFDNIPVVSFILLGGRCRACRERIPWRSPVVELTSGVLWYLLWKFQGGAPLFWVSVTFLSLLLVAGLADLETGLIPDEVSLVGIGVGLNASFFYPGLHQHSSGVGALGLSLAGLLTGGGLIYLTGGAGNWIFQKELVRLKLQESMGGGDVKLLAMAGTFLGWENALLTFFTAPILALPFALYGRLVKNQAVIPYGPFLAAAAAIQFFWGDAVWQRLIYGGLFP